MAIKIKKNYNLAFSLFCSESWSLTLRIEHRLRFTENGMLRKLFGPERDEVNRKKKII
jgi:hypothetical protein